MILMKKFLYIFIIACLPVFSSCDDYLNIVPKGEKIPTTLADFESLLRDEYTIGQTPVSNALYLLNDYYVTVSNLNSPTLTRANYMWDESADRIMLNNSDEGTYYQMYAAISSCNLIIENAPTATEATDAERAEVIAYAKVIRSLCYYVLVNYYADTYEAATAGEKLSVPLIVSSVIDAPSEQVTIQEMYDFIIQGVEEAIDGGLPEESMTVIHPNLGAAYAFLARVYLQMQDYTKALEYAELALGIPTWRITISAAATVLRTIPPTNWIFRSGGRSVSRKETPSSCPAGNTAPRIRIPTMTEWVTDISTGADSLPARCTSSRPSVWPEEEIFPEQWTCSTPCVRPVSVRMCTRL